MGVVVWFPCVLEFDLGVIWDVVWFSFGLVQGFLLLLVIWVVICY